METYLDRKPYLIDAVIGNSRMLASLTSTGRVVRLWWPHVDFPQHVDVLRAGLQVGNRGGTSWFDGEGEGWTQRSAYAEGTNIYCTSAESDDCPIAAEAEQFAVPGEDLLVRAYRFENRGTEPATFVFVHYSSFAITESPLYNTTEFAHAADALLHYRSGYFFALSSANVCTGYQAGNAWEHATRGTLPGAPVDMLPDGALSWRFDRVGPGETRELAVYLTAGRTREDALAAMDRAKARAAGEWRERTRDYWASYLASAKSCPSARPDIRSLYERSLLAMKLMADEASGAIIAAPEFDERFSRCGGYAYCWGRDAAFITTALDQAGLLELSDKFYDWALTAQDPHGAWQQRHYHDGTQAPSWGIQLDEGASLLWGMRRHYQALLDERGAEAADAFLRRVWPAVRKGADYLAGRLDPDTGLPSPSMDLWEERKAEHTYTAGAVYAGLAASARLAERLDDAEAASRWSDAAETVRQAILFRCWNEARGGFYRSLKWSVPPDAYEAAVRQGDSGAVVPRDKGYSEYMLDHDETIDVSLLGLSVPFGVLDPEHPMAARSADTIERVLTAPGVGGIFRYENDRYAGGNPWILTTLWLAHYRAERGQRDRAQALFDWAVRHRTAAGLLPEQVDRHTGTTAWVVPLTWSHAMFILAVHLLEA